MSSREKTKCLQWPAAWCVAAVLGVVFAGCEEPPVAPGEGESAIVVLDKGLNVYLVVDSDKARSGSTIHVEAKVRSVGEELTPTAFVANLRYDPERLEPIGVGEQSDNVIRAVNLHAAPGLVRVAGAAANGLGTETLVVLTMRVKQGDYLGSLSIDLDELTVVQRDFADMTAHVQARAMPVLERSTIIEKN